MKTTQGLICSLTLVTLMTACSDENTIANVNGRAVSDAEFNAYLAIKRVPADDKKRRDSELDSYLQREALAAQIENTGSLNQHSIDAQINEFRKQTVISRYFEQFLADKASEQEIRNYYNSNPDQFKSLKARVAHILIRVNTGVSDVERQALETRAQEVFSKANRGDDFAELARAYSDDKRSAQQGGDLGWINQGAVEKSFSDAVFAMSPEQIVGPIKSSVGLHIVKMIEAPKDVKQPYEKVRGDIRYQLRQQAKQAEMQRLHALSNIEKVGGR